MRLPRRGMTWEEAILCAYDAVGGCSNNERIYTGVGKFKPLTKAHLRVTSHGGRTAFVHQVRKHITNLVRKGDLVRLTEADNCCLTDAGRLRAASAMTRSALAH